MGRLRVFVEPFRVICETCHARLKVSSASAIGEIHACPKCGSMVEIRPPADGTAPQPSTIGSASIEIGAAAMPTFDDVAMATADVAKPPAAVTPATPMPPSVSGPSKFLWWGIGGASVLVAGGFAAVMMLGGRESTSPQAAPVAQTSTNRSATSEPDSIVVDPPTETPVAAPEPGSSETVAAASESSNPAADPPSLPALPPAEPEPAAESATKQTPTPTATSAAAPQASAAAAAKEKPRPKPVMSLDPLDFDPSQFSFGADGPTPATSESGSIPKNADVPAGAVETDVNAPVAEKAPLPEVKVDRTLTMRLGPMPNGGEAPHRTAEQLGTRLESFAVSDMPLSQFVETVTDLADVAVTLDPIELELAGVSPRQKVSVDSKDVTIEKALRDVFAKQRLELVERDGQASVALADGDRRRVVTYDVADLTGSEDATSIANLVQKFVAPDSWTAADGGGSIKTEKSKLSIDQTQRVRHEALIFLERLRLARGLPQRSRYPAPLLAIGSPYESAAPVLKQQTTFTFLPWTRLSDVLRHVQDVSKLTVLVDWKALGELELDPSSPVSCSANNRSWEDALGGILEPIGLTWWAVNGDTIQVTSREALDDIRRIEFYAVPKALRDQFASGDALNESLQKELAELDAKSQPLIMELDEPSGRLIVLGTPASHRLLSQRLGSNPKQVVSQTVD